MSLIMWVIEEDETKKIVAISEKKSELEQAVLRMKVSQVLKDMNVTESEFFDRLGKIKLSIKQKTIADFQEKVEEVKPAQDWKLARNKEAWIEKNPNEVFCDCLGGDKCMPHCNRFTRRQRRLDIDKSLVN